MRLGDIPLFIHAGSLSHVVPLCTCKNMIMSTRIDGKKKKWCLLEVLERGGRLAYMSAFSVNVSIAVVNNQQTIRRKKEALRRNWIGLRENSSIILCV